MKRNLWFAAMVSCGLFVGKVVADDVEIYFTQGVESSPYVLLIPDMSSNSWSTFEDVTDLAGSMTAASYQQLLDFRDGDPTGTCTDAKASRWEVYRAVLATVLRLKKPNGEDIWDPNEDASELLFGDLTVAMASANWGPGGNILQGYGKLSTPGFLNELLQDLQEPPCKTQGKASHKTAIKDTYLEWMAYINGYPVVSGMAIHDGNNGKPANGNFLGLDANGEIHPSYDPNTIVGVTSSTTVPIEAKNPNGRVYDSPFDNSSCPALYSILASMTGTVEGQDGDSVNDVDHKFGSVFAKSETMIEHMHKEGTDMFPAPALDQLNIPMEKTWVITDLGGVVCDPNVDNVASCGRSDVGEMAQAGGTAPLDITDAAALEEDLKSVFGEILSVSSSFVSASVPVNVFNQTETLNNIYTALFEAQDTLNWPGNVKKLRLADTDADGVFDDIVDVNGEPGFETTGSNKGRIFYSALTFWSDPNNLDTGVGSDPNEADFVPARKDGRVVDRGGSGQQVPGLVSSYPYFIGTANGLSSGGKASRTVYVESAGAIVDFDVDLASTLQVALDANDVTEAGELIRYGRGMDIDAAPGDPNTAARDWILGDSIHSRPFALNYGDTDGPDVDGFDPNNPNIRVLYGTGNGSFHMLDNIESGWSESGKEIFAYYPQETLGQLRRRRDLSKIAEGTDMRYGVDGEPVVLTVDSNTDQSLTDGDSGDEAYVFFGLRRGGFSYHALDIINPDDPKLQWKITHTRDDASSAFDELGLTFSTPRVTTVDYDGASVDALVFAGGYYGGWDPNTPGATSQIGKDISATSVDDWGNAIYIVNARTGDLIWKATGRKGASDAATTDTGAVTESSYVKYVHGDMNHSMPSDVTVVENDAGILHRIYVGDTGGNVWRADTPGGACDSCAGDQRDNWFVSRLANLADGNDIRFFHAPDIVQVKDKKTGTPFDGLLIQSGNRADPLDKRFSAVQNYLYYMRDYNILSGDASNVINGTPGSDEAPNYLATSFIDRTECIDPNNPESDCNAFGTNVNGWKIKLGLPGEKGLSTPLVDFGRVFSSTYVPGSAGVCGQSPEGFGKLYITNLVDGTAVGNTRSYKLGPGIPPSPVLIGDAIWLPGGGVDVDLDGDGKTDDLLTKSFTQRLIPIYWREPGIDDL